jgi:hypothetical protein
MFQKNYSRPSPYFLFHLKCNYQTMLSRFIKRLAKTGYSSQQAPDQLLAVILVPVGFGVISGLTELCF